MSREKRSELMKKIRGKNTGPEKILRTKLDEKGMVYDQHVKDLPGRPDFVFGNSHLVVFVDGDFWHGWRFPLWKHKLTRKWQLKIEQNRTRDQRNFRQLRRAGWKVLRIWEHQIEQEPEKCLLRVLEALREEG